MNLFYKKRAIRTPLAILSLLGAVGAVLLMLYQFWIGLFFAVIFAMALAMAWKMENESYQETEKYIETLSYRMKKVGEEALLELPIGIILLNDKYLIEWVNPFVSSIFPDETWIGTDLYDMNEGFRQITKEDNEQEVITLNNRSYRVYYKPEEKLLYLFDVT